LSIPSNRFVYNFGTIRNLGYLIQNFGTIHNFGTIYNFGTIDNSGTINDSGTIINLYSHGGRINNNCGTINCNNSGCFFRINNNCG